MGVRNAGLAIKEARLKAGLTQEQLSEGICSVQSLSRIENNIAGVSPSTFQALMAHAGAPCEAFPTFANRTDFECFYTLKRARFYLDAWLLEETYEELEKIESMNWADNKFYYQEWALLHCKLQFRSYCGKHEQILKDLIAAIQITRPRYTIIDFGSMLLSIVELELFILLAQEYLYTNHVSECMTICKQIETYLENSQMTFLEKERLLAENAIVYSKCCIAIREYTNALKIADTHRHQMVLNGINALIYELTFLTGLGYYFLNDDKKAFSYFRMAFLSSYAIHSVYAKACKVYWVEVLKAEVPDLYSNLPEIECKVYQNKKIVNSVILRDGTYDLFSPDVITIGKLIYLLRTEQKIPQNVLCQGLCSKSKLSKIENDMLQPTIALTEILLQRLGISDRVFTFWGDGIDAEFYELTFRLIRSNRKSKIEIEKIFEKLCKLSETKNPFIMQRFLFEKVVDGLTHLESNSEADILSRGLEMTLPKFDFACINNYRLSWMELTILNNLANTITEKNPSYIAIMKLQHILSYMKSNPYDIILQKNIFPITINFFTRQLYLQKYYQEVVQLENLFAEKILCASIESLGGCFFFYCQSLCECNDRERGTLYAHITCAIEEMVEHTGNSAVLKKYFLEDFGIVIE